jgi:cysteinyl-tRNA synthetase
MALGPTTQDPSEMIREARQGFEEAMDDDLNISLALACLFKLVKGLNLSLDSGSLGKEGAEKALEALAKLNEVVDVMDMGMELSLDDEILALMEERERARSRKDWAEADRIRRELLSRGIQPVDTSSGTRWIPLPRR